MDDVEKGHTSIRKAVWYWNIPLTSLLSHMNDRTICRKMGPQGMLIKKEDETIVIWVLNMQKVGLYVTFQQLKMKVVEIT
jgi:hypothetical protein